MLFQAKNQRTLETSERLLGIPSHSLNPLKGLITFGIQEIFKKLPQVSILYSVESIFQSLSEQRSQLWVVLSKDGSYVSGFVITQIVVYPKAHVLEVPFAWHGEDDGVRFLQEVYDYLQGFALEKNCVYMGGYGRKGWTRALGGDWFELSKFIKEVTVNETLH